MEIIITSFAPCSLFLRLNGSGSWFENVVHFLRKIFQFQAELHLTFKIPDRVRLQQIYGHYLLVCKVGNCKIGDVNVMNVLLFRTHQMVPNIEHQYHIKTLRRQDFNVIHKLHVKVGIILSFFGSANQAIVKTLLLFYQIVCFRPGNAIL